MKCHVWGVFFYSVVFRLLCDRLFVTDRLIVSALSPQESTFRAHKNWRISRIISSFSNKGGPEVMCIHLIGLDRPSANEDRCLISHQYIVMDRITEPGNSKKSDYKFIDQNSVTPLMQKSTRAKISLRHASNSRASGKLDE